MLSKKRVYDENSQVDGERILVDRLWPRGVTKERAQIDCWTKEITPSNSLRKAYHEHEISYDVSKRINEERFSKAQSN